jgi:2-polyprenyl-3-methyl-5-hydroxy-6-metoxy-1,4-benzoquinol methylase
LPARRFDVITSNSLLHHLHDPQVLWKTIKHCHTPGGLVQVMDLYRPGNEIQAKEIVRAYAANEAAILQDDFYHSLLAAFTPDEISDQLSEAGLHCLTVSIVSDRHLLVHGKIK